MKRMKFLSERIKRIGSAITAMVVLTAIFPKECISANIESQPYTWIVKGIEAEDIYTSDTKELLTECLTDVEHFNLEYATLLMERYSIIKTDDGYNCIDYLGNTLLEEWCSDKLFYLPKGEIAGYKPEVTIERGESGLVFYDYLGGYGGGYETLTWDNQNSYRCLGGPVNDLQGANYSIYIYLDRNVPCEFYDNEHTGKYVLASGNEIISDEIYDNVQYGFRSDIYAFEKDGFWYYLNQEGESVLDFGVKTIVNEMDYDVCPHLFTDGYVVVSDSNGYSLYDETGKQVIKSGTFNKINPVYNGYAWVQDSETKLWGVIKINDYTPKEQPDESWRYIYEKKLREIMTEVDSSSAYGWRKFSLEYITDDSVPELVVSGGTFRGPYYTVYTIENNEIKELATGGSFSYLTGKSTLITQNRSGMYTDTTIYDMKNEKTISLVSGAEYKLDGQTITADEFQDLINSYVINVLYAEVQSGYEVNEQNIDHVLQLDKLRIIEKFSTDLLPEIDPFVQAHLNFIEENPNTFKNVNDFEILKKTRELALNFDTQVTEYLALKNIQDFFAGDIELDKGNVEMSVQALVGELLCNEEMVARLDASAQQAIEDANNQILKEMQKYSDYFGLTDDMIEAVDQLVSTTDKSTTVYKNSRAEFLSKYLKNTDIKQLSSGLGLLSDGTKFLSIGVDILNETTEKSENLYQFWLTCVAYEASNDSLQDAFKLLVDYVQEEAKHYVGGTDDYSQRIMLIAKELSFYYKSMMSASEDNYELYASKMACQVAISTADKIATTMVVDLVETVVAYICPQLLLIGIVFDVTMSVWEQFTMVDERALERDMYLNMAVFTDAISKAMNDETNGYAGNLIKNKTLHSAYVYEEGVGFYKRIIQLAVNHAVQYYAMMYEDIIQMTNVINADCQQLAYISAGMFGTDYVNEVMNLPYPLDYTDVQNMNTTSFKKIHQDIKKEILKLSAYDLEDVITEIKNISCHGEYDEPIVFIEDVIYVVLCPVNLTIKHGDIVVAEVVNDTLTLLDESVPVSVNIIKEEDDIYASKFVVVPSDYAVEITGYADGTMYFEKAIVENGSLSAVSTITDVPVQNGSSYTEVVKNDTTVALDCDLDGDGMKDETLSAEVSKFDESNDESNVPTLMAESISGKAGEIIELDVKLLNNPGIIALSFDIEYDNTKLKLLGAEDGKILGDSTSTFGNDLAMIPYRLAWDGAANKDNTGNGTVAKLKFEILETADTGKTEVKIKLNQGSTFNVELEGVEFATVSGMVNIGEYTEATTTTSPVITTETVTGDVNNDGIVSIVDLIKLVQHILKPEIQINSQNSDMNSDGKINLTDVVELKKLFLR
ncbi:MAG: cohesin domain-containing protein [Oscillospiraceae bacterium]|nr:cohesin domain-containing protein [Oscillospiraceae bacterium]